MKTLNSLKKLYAISQFTNKESLLSPLAFFFKTAIVLFRTVILSLIYKTVFFSGQAENNERFLIAIWSIATVIAIYSSLPKNLDIMKKEIQSGEFELKMTKPFSIFEYYFFQSLANVFLKLIINVTATSITLALLFGFPAFSIKKVIFFIFFAILGIVVNILINLLINSSVFFIQNPEPIEWIIKKTAWFFNGNFVPVFLLPASFQIISDFYPLSAGYYSARVFSLNDKWEFIRLFLFQFFWLFVIYFLTVKSYKAGIKKFQNEGT